MTSSRQPSPELPKSDPPAIEPQQIRDFDDLLPIIRARIVALGVAHQTVDAVAGLSEGYCSKIVGPGRAKQLGRISAPALLGALALKLVVVEDPAALARLRSRLVPRRRKGHSGQ
jgi:hypothetical protein